MDRGQDGRRKDECIVLLADDSLWWGEGSLQTLAGIGRLLVCIGDLLGDDDGVIGEPPLGLGTDLRPNFGPYGPALWFARSAYLLAAIMPLPQAMNNATRIQLFQAHCRRLISAVSATVYIYCLSTVHWADYICRITAVRP